jgi:hypothetical protein
MNTFGTIIPAIQFNKVFYYTIYLEDEEESLFLGFINNHQSGEHTESMALIRSWLSKLGEEIGAKEPYFRFEAFRGGVMQELFLLLPGIWILIVASVYIV